MIASSPCYVFCIHCCLLSLGQVLIQPQGDIHYYDYKPALYPIPCINLILCEDILYTLQFAFIPCPRSNLPINPRPDSYISRNPWCTLSMYSSMTILNSLHDFRPCTFYQSRHKVNEQERRSGIRGKNDLGEFKNRKEKEKTNRYWCRNR